MGLQYGRNRGGFVLLVTRVTELSLQPVYHKDHGVSRTGREAMFAVHIHFHDPMPLVRVSAGMVMGMILGLLLVLALAVM